MLLEDCPLCQLILEKKNVEFGKYCASMTYEGAKTVALLRHEFQPTFEEVDEAIQMLGEIRSLLTDTGVVGHWSVSAKAGNWPTEGKSEARNDTPNKSE